MCHRLASYFTVHSLIILSLKVGFYCAITVLIMCKLTINCKAEMNTTCKQRAAQRGPCNVQERGYVPSNKAKYTEPTDVCFPLTVPLFHDYVDQYIN